jgi:hypothetical protein
MDARLGTASAASAAAGERASASEEALRRTEVDAAQQRSKVASLEGALRSANKHAAQMKVRGVGRSGQQRWTALPHAVQ